VHFFLEDFLPSGCTTWKYCASVTFAWFSLEIEIMLQSSSSAILEVESDLGSPFIFHSFPLCLAMD
jgi:hypothetical protein